MTITEAMQRMERTVPSLCRVTALGYLCLICTPPILFLEWLWRITHRKQVAAALQAPIPKSAIHNPK